MYFVQMRSSWAVTRWPSLGSSSRISRPTVHLMLSQWYALSGLTIRSESCGFLRIQSPDYARDGSVEQLPVDRVELVERFDLLVIADRELLRLEPVGHVEELRHSNGHR